MELDYYEELKDYEEARIESEVEVLAFIQNIKYALEHNAEIIFQESRKIDEKRDIKYTNKYTLATLFPNENPKDVLRQELLNLKVEDYLRTVKDRRFPNKSEMREFGKVYNGTEDVYIKCRVELFNENGRPSAFVMSFHFAMTPLAREVFPYKKEKDLNENESIEK